MTDLKKLIGAFAILTIMFTATACSTVLPTHSSTPTPQMTDTLPVPTFTQEPTWTPVVLSIPTVVQSATLSGQQTPTVQPAKTNPVNTGAGSVAADKYQYLAQNVADGKQFRPGTAILITWTIKNTGTTLWTKTYTLKFFAGPTGSGPAVILFGKEVQPGGSLSLSTTIKTPAGIGDYDTWYKLTNDQLQNFGDLDFKYTVSNQPSNQIQPTATP
ncbi:MAG TPA: NBR1-Ig-like domain-containing protein [Anaerolineaceae bacterium]|jgi:Ig-like domain from next to BRCA1 gene